MKERKQRADGRDEWSTPWPAYRKINLIWQFCPAVDLFASAENTKCRHFITEEMDAFKVDLRAFCEERDLVPWFWLQPPYSKPIMPDAIELAIRESKKGYGAKFQFLLPARVDQKWFYNLIEPYPHKFWPGRIAFIPPAGVMPSSPREGSVHGVIS